ncbi:hypothetical protein A6E01_20405 (plasmid) [Vibrio breoganii]|uniref:Uncharacterized protein n=1 Tax=Vibrio breoganii TaxID=553239 RepID=A0AAN0XZG0_9VIBR|nr:hypothetical protein [Vibrio breoganii]ANO35577.1 hypothetical protein A6E01_20405 [Vibrio breoganii]
MTRRIYLKALTLLAIAITFSGPTFALELTKDNPSTLTGTNSSDYTIAGLKLGMTHQQAWDTLDQNDSLVGIKDTANPSRIWVYTPDKDGNHGHSALYLVWEPGNANMKSITVFQDYRSHITPNLRRLLSFEAIDNNSAFKKDFIGYSNRSEVTLDIPSTDLKLKSYYYDDIGLEIIDKHSSEGDEVVFSIYR